MQIQYIAEFTRPDKRSASGSFAFVHQPDAGIARHKRLLRSGRFTRTAATCCSPAGLASPRRRDGFSAGLRLQILRHLPHGVVAVDRDHPLPTTAAATLLATVLDRFGFIDGSGS